MVLVHESQKDPITPDPETRKPFDEKIDTYLIDLSIHDNYS